MLDWCATHFVEMWLLTWMVVTPIGMAVFAEVRHRRAQWLAVDNANDEAVADDHR